MSDKTINELIAYFMSQPLPAQIGIIILAVIVIYVLFRSGLIWCFFGGGGDDDGPSIGGGSFSGGGASSGW